MRIVCVQNMATEGFGRFERHFRAGGHEVAVVRAFAGEALPRPETCDAVVVGGTPLAAYRWRDHSFLRDEAAFLQRAVAELVPCLGVCFGAQFLAELLGGRALAAGRHEIGRYDVHLTEEGRRDPVLAGFPPDFPVFQWHGDTFELPTGAALLARGDGVRNQMYRRDHVVGVQFHLEVTVEEVQQWCEAYTGDLALAGKSPAEVVGGCREIDAEMDRLTARLLDNFLAVTR